MEIEDARRKTAPRGDYNPEQRLEIKSWLMNAPVERTITHKADSFLFYQESPLGLQILFCHRKVR